MALTTDTPQRGISDLLGSLDVFAACGTATIDAVSACVTGTTTLREGDILCAEGETADSWWVLVDGTADVSVGGRFVGTIGRGEAVGEIAMLLGDRRSATVRATSELAAVRVAGDRFNELLASAAGVGDALARGLASRLRDTNDVLRGSTPIDERPRVVSVTKPEVRPEPVVWDPNAPGYFQDPYPMMDSLREQASVHWAESTHSYLLTRYEHVRAVTRDRDHSVDIRQASPSPSRDQQVALLDARGDRGASSMLRLDAPDHTRLRKLVSRAFTPRAIQSWRSRTEEITNRLLDQLSERDSFDVVHDYATLVPCQVISEMLGMPLGDIPNIRDWSNAIVKSLDPITTDEDRAAGLAGTSAMYGYVSDVVDDKRRHPGDDILSTLIEAEEEGERLTHPELIDQVVLLYVAGHETTINLIANGVKLLLERPDQRHLLVADPTLDANAVEEVLRFDPVVLLNRRIATKDLEIDGTAVAAGSVLSLSSAAANRDPRGWGPSAGEFDIRRPGAHEHTTFGGGAHYCLGQALARMEGQVALPAILRRFPDLDLAAEPVYLPRIIFRALEGLPVAR